MVVRQPAVAGLEQDPVCNRVRPQRLRQVIGEVDIGSGGFGRRGCSRGGNPIRPASVAATTGLPLQRRTLAARLVLMGEADAVLRRYLRRGADLIHRAALRLSRRETIV